MRQRYVIGLDGSFMILPAMGSLICALIWVEPYYIFEMQDAHFGDACSTHISVLHMKLQDRDLAGRHKKSLGHR